MKKKLAALVIGGLLSLQGVCPYGITVNAENNGMISADRVIQLEEFNYSDELITIDLAVPIVNAENNDSAFLRGDINSDGEFNVADVAVFQRWLLGDSFYGDDIKLNNWKAADLCNDGRLDVFDLCLMKQELLKNGEPAELPTLIEISEMSNEKATELFSKYTFQDIESIWRKFDYYHSGLYGGGWKIGDKNIGFSFDFYTQKLDWVMISPLPTEDDYIRSFIRQKVNSPYQTVERFTSTIYSTEEYNLKNRVTSITVYGVDGEIMTSGELRLGVAKTVVVCYDENKRLEYEVMY